MIFTIGHSNHTLDYFLDQLRTHSVELVVDVRSEPYSAAVPHFNKQLLERRLLANGIDYVWEPDLGARPADPSVYVDGRLNYRALSEKPSFRQAMARIGQLNTDRRLALMCSEHDPLECPRFLLVGKLLKEAGVTVQHILSSGLVEEQKQVEHRLLGRTKRANPDLFMTPDESLAEAYRRQEENVTKRRSSTKGPSSTAVD